MCLNKGLPIPRKFREDFKNINGRKININMFEQYFRDGNAELAVKMFSSIQFSRSVMSDSLRPHELQHAMPPCPSPTPRFTQTHVH